MKAKSEKYRYNILLILLLGLVGALLVTTNYSINSSSCNNITVNFGEKSAEAFLTQNDIIKTVTENLNIPITGTNLQAIDLRLVEQTAQQIAFVKQADAFFDSNNTLNVNIIEKRPLVRVINSNNVSYYIDSEQNKFEVSPNFTVRVVLASGFIKDDKQINVLLSSDIDKAIFKLANYIDGNQLWKAMIEQIYVEANGDFVLIPKVGDFEILLGSVANLELKFKKLENFYKKDVAIEQPIEVVNLKYNNQILCELKQPKQ